MDGGSSALLLLGRQAPAGSARAALRAAALAEAEALAADVSRRRAAVRAQLAAADALETLRLAAAAAAASASAASASSSASFDASSAPPRAPPCRCPPVDADAPALTAGGPGACRGACGCGAVEVAVSGAPAANWYRGRPLTGATSGALYVGAEAAFGFPPPRRAEFVVPPETLGGAGGAGGAGASLLSPAVLAEAQGVLKRPSFPDRAFALGAPGAGGARVGAGSVLLRRLAAARDADDAAVAEDRLHGMHAAALRAIARL